MTTAVVTVNLLIVIAFTTTASTCNSNAIRQGRPSSTDIRSATPAPTGTTCASTGTAYGTTIEPSGSPRSCSSNIDV
jgi:hypothetical protein